MKQVQEPCLLDVLWDVTKPTWAPSDQQLQSWVLAAMQAGLGGAMPTAGVEVSLLLTDASEICRLNREYRQVDKATNVLSFPAQTLVEDQRTLMGDLVICPSVVEAEALTQSKLPLIHLIHLVIHAYCTWWDTIISRMLTRSRWSQSKLT